MSSRKKCDYRDYFEEFTGEFFRELGCEMEPQPRIGDRRSDFLATPSGGERFYVEATVFRPVQFSEHRPPEDDVCRKLDEMCGVPYLYWLTASASGELYEHLSRKHLEPIRQWIEGLSTGGLQAQSARFTYPSGTPPKNVQPPSETWEIEIYARPRPETTRGLPSPLLAGFGRGGGIDVVTPFIYKARAKAKQHRNAEAPVVLAVADNADFPLDQIDLSVALFGCEQSAETGISRITPPREDLRRRSIWGKRENSAISGILLFHGLWPGKEQQASVCLYGNPHARYPLQQWVKKTFPYAHVQEKRGVQYLVWPLDRRLSSVLDKRTESGS